MALMRLVALAAVIGTAGCAVTPMRDAADSAAGRVEAGAAVAPAWPPGERTPAAIPRFAERLTLAQALATAFERNPEIRLQYAELGLAHAELRDAARIVNPTLSFAWLEPDGGGRDKTTRGITASFADLLLLPARRRLSAAEFRRVELAVGAALVALAREVEIAWYRHVGNLQVEAMRAAVAEAARRESELAARFHEAGNITRLQLDRQVAASSRAEIEALGARTEAAESRERLANLLGLPAAGEWRTVDRLSSPPDDAFSAHELAGLALAQRLDLAAARERAGVLEDALGVARAWRLLGSVEAGYEEERETDGSKLRGPTLSLELPIFNQGQAAIARARANLLSARARADALTLEIENEVTTGIVRLALARQASERYRQQWLPAAASTVERQQERFNYMLVGAFDLLQAKRDQYDAWQGYFQSVRDYWVARAELRAATGGLLPGDSDALPPAAGPGDIAPPPQEAGEESPPPPTEHHGDHRS